MNTIASTNSKIINCRAFASNILQNVDLHSGHINKIIKRQPHLATIIVGHDESSHIYVNRKIAKAAKVGIKTTKVPLAENVSQDILHREITLLNYRKDVDAILLQLPLPNHLNKYAAINTINPTKDVDGLCFINAGKLSVPEISNHYLIPCTALGCLHIAKKIFAGKLQSKKVLIINASPIVGRPLANLLMREKCTVTIANSQTINLKNECLQADIIVSATGKPNLIKGDMVHSESVIIDVGIYRHPTISNNLTNNTNSNNNEEDEIYTKTGEEDTLQSPAKSVVNEQLSDKKTGGDNTIASEKQLAPKSIQGDVDVESCLPILKAITPVPGGVGPMTIAYLMVNTLLCCYNNHLGLIDDPNKDLLLKEVLQLG